MRTPALSQLRSSAFTSRLTFSPPGPKADWPNVPFERTPALQASPGKSPLPALPGAYVTGAKRSFEPLGASERPS
jgi:hypothetical protein